jgi:hypothetical protein
VVVQKLKLETCGVYAWNQELQFQFFLFFKKNYKQNWQIFLYIYIAAAICKRQIFFFKFFKFNFFKLKQKWQKLKIKK